MSDINAAPSSTEPSNEVAKTDMQEAGAATAGESGSTSGDASLTSGTNADSQSTSENIASATTDVAGSNGSTDAPAVAVSGELSAADMVSSADVGAAIDTGDAGNVAASPAGGQSASDTALSAQGASLVGGTVGVALPDEVARLRSTVAELAERLRMANARLTDEQANVAKWQGLYNAATAAKPHAQSLLQKLEAGEAIVLGDLQSKLRAFVDAL